MGFVRIPLIPRTTRPSVAGTPVWYAEATIARAQLDINITIPSGNARKLIVFHGTNGGEFATAVTFDPAGVAFPMIPIDGAFGEIGSLRIAAYYLDTPPTGAKVVRIATAGAVRSVASLKVYQHARAGAPQAMASAAIGETIFETLGEAFLLDAFSETCDLVLGLGLSNAGLTPAEGQIAGADDVVNAAFLATASNRTHQNNGDVSVGWTAASSTDLLMAAVNVLFSSGQTASQGAIALFEWGFNETSSPFLDTHGRSNAAVISGTASGGHAPLFSGGGTSISMQGAQIQAAHHVDAQVQNWSAEIYLQPRALPASGTNDAIFGKDGGLPVPGGFQVELESNGAIDFYIRDATGLAGTAVHVTPTSGDGTLTLNAAHVIHLTYNDATKTAAIYLDRSLLASKTDANFAGLANNASPFSLFSRHLSSGVEFNGIGDRATFFSGVLTAAEIAARPAPTTITDPLAPGVIVAVADNAGDVSPSTTTDVDVLANDTGKTGPHYDIEIVSNPAGRLSVINDQTATAKVRITTPAAPSSTTNESGTYRVREGTSPTFGNPSNQATISWRRPGTGGGGGYTPFPFVTQRTPTISHAGCASRPPYSASNPRSQSFIDPMSGLEVFRITGNAGSNVLLRGSVDSGLDFPTNLKAENNPRCPRAWNADATLLMLVESKGRSGDPSNPARCVLISADGSHMGATQPWQIIRAGPSSFNEVPATGWFWDPLNPLRAYAGHSDGMYEWWPAGAPGKSVGQKTKIFNWPSGFSQMDTPRGGRAQPSHDGLTYFVPCKRNSDAKWGGFRCNLVTGATGPFFEHPLNYVDDKDLAIQSTGPLGIKAIFAHANEFESEDFQIIHMTTGVRQGVFVGVAGHHDYVTVNNKEYVFGWRNGTWRMFDLANGAITHKADDPNLGVEHPGCPQYFDTFENHGAAGGSTQGMRYAMCAISSPSSRQGILGLRLGLNDNNVWRYICHHRGFRNENTTELHPHASPNFEYVVFNSNWTIPGVETNTAHVNSYVVVIPDAWRSPNNDGS